MKFYLLLILFLFSDATLCLEICRSCEGEFKDVAVTFSSAPRQVSDVGWELRLKSATWHFWKKPHQVKNEGVVEVSSLAEIQSLLKSLANQCKRVKFLGFYSHGDNGVMAIKDDLLNRKNVESVFKDYGCVMSEDATISIFGCSVARECDGQYFLAKFGRTLLVKGGTITAPTSLSQQYPLVPPFTFNFSPEKIKISSDGKGVAHNQYSIAQCLRDKEAEALQAIKTLDSCGFSNNAQSLRRKTEKLAVLRQGLGSNTARLVTDMNAAEAEVQEEILSGIEEVNDDLKPDNRIKFYLKCLQNYYKGKTCK